MNTSDGPVEGSSIKKTFVNGEEEVRVKKEFRLPVEDERSLSVGDSKRIIYP